VSGQRSVQPRSRHPQTRAASAGFSASARVRAKAEFARAFADGQRVGHPLLALHLLRDAPDAALGARLGLAVSRKVDPRAVGRNRIKRVVRDAFRRQRLQLASGSYVVVARAAARGADNAALRAAFAQVLQRAGALPPPGLTGTMPPPPPDAD
jgi:ribonuclease P protein component